MSVMCSIQIKTYAHKVKMTHNVFFLNPKILLEWMFMNKEVQNNYLHFLALRSSGS